MLKYVILFLTFLFLNAHAKYAVIDIIPSDQSVDETTTTGTELYEDDGAYDFTKRKGCFKQNYDGSCTDGTNTVDCNCPAGSQCIEKDPTVTGDQNTCRSMGKTVHQGAVGFDFESSNVIKAPTQVDLSNFAFTTAKDDAEQAGAHKKNRFHLYRTVLKSVNQAKYESCSVSLRGPVVDQLPASNAPSVTSKAFSTTTGEVVCAFRVLNKGYLGLISANVTFVKKQNLLDLGEKGIDSVEVHLRYVPSAGDDQWHNPEGDDWENVKGTLFPQHDKAATEDQRYLSAAHNSGESSTDVFRFELKSGSSDIKIGESKAALKGTLQLPITGIFFDQRYKVIDQSGAESLNDGLGDGLVRKEGMEIHYDFKDFYDASKDALENTGVNMNAVDKYSDYLTNVHASLKNAAQYKMDHTYVFKYGGSDGDQMPHFQKEYLSCPLCSARIVFKAFEKSNAYPSASTTTDKKDYLLRYHAPVNVNDLPTASNSILLDDVDVEVVQNVIGHTTDGTDIHAIRLPTELDPQRPDGHALGEFFTAVKAPDQKTYTSLIDNYEILGSRFDIQDSSGTIKSSAAQQGCTTYGSGKLYQLGFDIVSKANEVFADKCRIEIPTGSFGNEYTLEYTYKVGASTKSAVILENDQRSVFSGNTELSILRRKVDTQAITNGASVSFDISKFNATGAISFRILGNHNMKGYANDGTLCTQSQVDNLNSATPDAAVHKQCTKVLSTADYEFTTATTDGVSTTITVESSQYCFMYFDIELQDTSKPDVRYGLRLPCVRTTSNLEDKLNLTYAFDTDYSLSEDRVYAQIDYDLPTGMDLTVHDYGFGTCGKNASNFDILVKPDTCTDVLNAEQPVNGWAVDATEETIKLDDTDKVTLNVLKECGTSPDGISDSENYVLEHYLGLVYRRDFRDGGREDEARTYCQDQKFVTTIRRDATASVSVATLDTLSLERSVMVTSIDWVQCASTATGCFGSNQCFKLRIEADSKEKETTSGSWSNSSLSGVSQFPGGANSDSMTVDADHLSSTNTGNYFALESECGVVNSCSDSAGTHYGDLSAGTKQEILIRGSFSGASVDTKVLIETKFDECPLDDTTDDLGGELKIGLRLLCHKVKDDGTYDTTDSDDGSGALSSVNSAVSFDDSGTETNYKDCATALASSKVEILSDIYIDGTNSTGLAKANTMGWTYKNIDWKINRYETDLLGNKDPSKLVSSDLIFEMRYQSGSSNYNCVQKAGKLTGMPNAFDSNILKCAASTGNAEAAIDGFEFDLAPLQSANMDVFEVEAIAVLRNNNLETRRLRSVFRLSANPVIDEKVGSLQVLPATKEVSDQGIASEHPSDEDRDDETHDTVHRVDTITIIVLVVAVLTLVGIGVVVVMKMRKKPQEVAPESELAPLNVGGFTGRSQRFSNLRY
jgi:hypothetical protein